MSELDELAQSIARLTEGSLMLCGAAEAVRTKLLGFGWPEEMANAAAFNWLMQRMASTS